jgi:hypothetical protein
MADTTPGVIQNMKVIALAEKERLTSSVPHLIGLGKAAAQCHPSIAGDLLGDG